MLPGVSDLVFTFVLRARGSLNLRMDPTHTPTRLGSTQWLARIQLNIAVSCTDMMSIVLMLIRLSSIRKP